ncbi:PLP-dependent aminotransferase family protein [Neptuniibacter halophilus]|uniref:aminotransferase-like domain-containing protein n=1 Tax=Neptuniibacter halophilus TaxID=651666 RepID=UPI002572F538|nr:PLP-dependent aminotransferase family protein [Neptuniibacter halophilus]
MYLYQDLEQELTQLIMQGQLPPGSRLPSIRQQCQERGLSKATVIHAYQRLEAAALVESRFKSGYYVCAPATRHRTPSEPTHWSMPQLVDMSDLMRDIMEQGAAFDICPHEEQGYDSLPAAINELNRCIGRALRRQKGSDHQYYDEPAGLPELRQQLSARYARLGCDIRAEDMVMTAGCQHALFLALQSCCRPGDTVAVESPGFYGVLQLLETLGLKVLEIPSSPEQGISVAALRSALEQWDISACVVTPAYATPTGSLLPQTARQALLDLAEEHDFILIEDDIYGDLGFSQRVAPLRQLDKTQRVILCGSLSKSLSRELRLGWVVASRPQQLKRLKMVNLLGLSRFTQQGVVDFISNGGYDRHLRRYRQQLRLQRDQLITLLDQHWRGLGEIAVSRPEGGLSLWVELAPGHDLAACYLPARSQGIVITPGNLFSAQERFSHCLRLSFAHEWTKPRQQALIRLGQILGGE